MFQLRFSQYIAGVWLATILIASIVNGQLGTDPTAIDLGLRLARPNAMYWLGTDELGRSVLSRILNAAQFTFLVTFSATILAFIIGSTMGLVAAWYGGVVDVLINGLVSLLWSLPFALVAVLVLTVLGPSASALILVLGGANWVTAARIMRAEGLRVGHSSFVQSAKALGFSSGHIMFRQMFPNFLPTAIVLLGFGAAETLALESGLAYLGLSLPPPLPTWGGMVADGLAYLSTGWWICLAPAAAIVTTIAGIRVAATMLQEKGR